MILTYKCFFGVPLPLKLTELFGEKVELEGLEFVNALLIEWRLVGD